MNKIIAVVVALALPATGLAQNGRILSVISPSTQARVVPAITTMSLSLIGSTSRRALHWRELLHTR